MCEFREKHRFLKIGYLNIGYRDVGIDYDGEGVNDRNKKKSIVFQKNGGFFSGVHTCIVVNGELPRTLPIW